MNNVFKVIAASWNTRYHDPYPTNTTAGATGASVPERRSDLEAFSFFSSEFK